MAIQLYSTGQIAVMAGVSRDRVQRTLKSKNIQPTFTSPNGQRLFSAEVVDVVLIRLAEERTRPVRGVPNTTLSLAK